MDKKIIINLFSNFELYKKIKKYDNYKKEEEIYGWENVPTNSHELT